jgi:hypothetical protein
MRENPAISDWVPGWNENCRVARRAAGAAAGGAQGKKAAGALVNRRGQFVRAVLLGSTSRAIEKFFWNLASIGYKQMRRYQVCGSLRNDGGPNAGEPSHH